MRQFYLSKLMVLIAILSGWNLSVSAQTVTFGYTGSVQSFSIGAGVTSVTVDAIGANGGNGYQTGCAAGKGGRVQCTMAVTPGTILYVYVGGKGLDGTSSCSGQAGGYNGGGNNGPSTAYAGSGGGASSVSSSSVITTYTSRVVVAGGGGGGGGNYSNSVGGDGGGTTGGSGGWNGTAPYPCYAGSGGTQSGGGISGTCYSPTGPGAGLLGLGGNGYSGGNTCYYTGGGGGGYWGGGAGGYYYGGGGGGSSFPGANGGIYSNVTHTQGFNLPTSALAGNGQVVISGPTVSSSSTLLAFGPATVGTTSVAMPFIVSGVNLTVGSSVAITAPADFLVSCDGGLTYSSSCSLTYPGTTLAATTMYAKFAPSTYSAYSANIVLSGGGIPAPINVSVTGNGATPCSGTPATGVATISPSSGYIATNFALAVSGVTGGGFTYQWQSSPFSTYGFTNISGAVFSTYNFTGITSTTYYRCVVTCASSGLSSTSNVCTATQVIAPSSCTPTCNVPGSVCSQWAVASSSYPLTVTGDNSTSLNDNTACTGNYIDQTATKNVSFTIGSSYSATVGYSTGNTNSNQAWIDFNNDGSFATSESIGGVASFSGSGVRSTPTWTIPSIGVVPGTYRLRVVSAYTSGCSGMYPCYPNIPSCPTAATLYYGEGRDYTVTILPQACSGFPAAGTVVSSSATSSCAPFSTTLTSMGGTVAPGITYSWQSSTISPTVGFGPAISGATDPFYTPSVSTAGPIYYRAVLTCGTLGSKSPAITLTLNTPPSNITGNTYVCTGIVSSLSSATSGGTWSSSNTSVADVNPSGVVSGRAYGVATITYTSAAGCKVTTPVTVNVTPALISGNTNVCLGGSTTLANTTAGGTWSSSSPTVLLSGPVVAGMGTGGAVVSYTMPSGCNQTAAITVNPLPSPITGTVSLCVGTTVGVSDPTPGGTWSSNNSFLASAITTGASTGNVSALASTTSTMPLLIYTLPTGCSVSTSINILPLPSPIGGNTTVCSGATTSLANATVGGGTWSSSSGTIATVDATTGVVTGNSAGVTTITFTDATVGCTITAPVTVNAVPTGTACGTGKYCSGNPVNHITTCGGTITGVAYVAYGPGYTSATLNGATGSDLDFGVVAKGTYTVQATDLTTHCSAYLTGNPVIDTFDPVGTYNVFAGPGYCPGTSGSLIGLDYSDPTVKYTLYYNGNLVPGVPSLSGINDTLYFGPFTDFAYPYTIKAQDGTTQCMGDMLGAATIVPNFLPPVYNVTGGGAYCVADMGVKIGVDHSDASVTYYLYKNNGLIDSLRGLLMGAPIDFGYRTDSGSYTVTGIDNTSGCQSTMLGNPKVKVNPLPAIYNVSGTGGYCNGSAGRHVGLDYSLTGVNYILYKNSLAIDSLPGTNSGRDFGVQTGSASGDVFTVIARNASTSCSVTMNGSAVLTEYPLPTAFTISPNAPSAYCSGDSGVHITLPFSDAGNQYQLYRGTSPVGSVKTGPGSGGSVDFGNVTVAGTYTILSRNPVTNCGAFMPGSTAVTISTRPTAYTLTGSGHFCTGSGRNVILNNSNTNVDYQLYNNNVPVGGLQSGLGTALDFGPQPLAGNYTAIGIDRTNSCPRTMNGNATLVADPLPAANTVTVTNGGNYCVGGLGQHIGLAASSTGIKYQLQMVGGGDVGSPLYGTGAALDFGLKTINGSYQILATNSITHCQNVMNGNPTITAVSLPQAYPVAGGGPYCAGSGGAVITMLACDSLVDYQLVNGSSLGIKVPGTPSSTLTFPPVTISGTYTVKATDATTGCSNIMSGTAPVTINPLPAIHRMTGGGSYCSGTTGVHIGLDGSDLGGYQYEVYNASGLVGTFWAGTGLPLDLGAQTAAGTYSVIATNSGTSCSVQMTGTATVSVIPSVTPSVTLLTGTGGSTVCSATPTVFTPKTTNGGTAPTFQWRVNGSIVSTGSTFSYFPSDNDSLSVIMTSNAVCPLPATVMDGMRMQVITSATPTVAITPSTGTNDICPGTSVTFRSAITAGGTAPTYSWQRNGVIVGTDSTYTVVPNDSDIIFCSMTSNFVCRLANTVFSNNELMNVILPTMPSVEVTANPGLNFVGGSTITFSSWATNAGSAATYKWKVNGNVISSATGATYTTNSLRNGDVVTSEVTSHTTCGDHLTASKSVSVHDVTATGIGSVAAVNDLQVMPNPNKGAFTVKGSLSAGSEEVSIEVTNMLGQTVYSNKIVPVNGNIDEQITLNSSLANGMYLLNVRSAFGNTVFHFVVEK